MKSSGHDRDACWETTSPLVAEPLAEVVRLGHVDHGRAIPCLRGHQHEVNPLVTVLGIILRRSTHNVTMYFRCFYGQIKLLLLPTCGAMTLIKNDRKHYCFLLCGFLQLCKYTIGYSFAQQCSSVMKDDRQDRA